MSNPDARQLERIDELLDAAGVAGPDSSDTVGRVEILIAAWDEMHREAREARDAVEAAIRQASPSERWVAVPHEEWRGILAATRPAADAQPRRFLNDDELAGLVKGERVVIGTQPFVVLSGPGDAGHPQFAPPPETVFHDPPLHRVFRDRRGL